MGVVDKAVNQCRCQPVVTKDGIPLGELQIGCNNQAPALIAVGDHLEQKLCRLLVQRNKAHLVNHNEFRFLHGCQIAVQCTFVVFLQQHIGKGCRCKETDSATLLAGFQRNGRCQMEFINPETGESMIGYIYKGNLAAEESENVEIQEEELSKVTEIPETIPDMTEGQVASTE